MNDGNTFLLGLVLGFLGGLGVLAYVLSSEDHNLAVAACASVRMEAASWNELLADKRGTIVVKCADGEYAATWTKRNLEGISQ